MSVTELNTLLAKLHDLRIEHSELNRAIDKLSNQTYLDSLELRRLKKRKLALKDTIVILESQLIPDLNA